MSEESSSILADRDFINNAVRYSGRSVYFEYPGEVDLERGDPLRTAKGLLLGILLAIPLWMLILGLIFLR